MVFLFLKSTLKRFFGGIRVFALFYYLSLLITTKLYNIRLPCRCFVTDATSKLKIRATRSKPSVETGTKNALLAKNATLDYLAFQSFLRMVQVRYCGRFQVSKIFR